MFISYGKDAVNKTLSLSLNSMRGVLFMASYFFVYDAFFMLEFCAVKKIMPKGDKNGT